MDFQTEGFQTVVVKVLRFTDGEVWLSLTPFVGKKGVYRNILRQLKLKLRFENYKTFEKIEPIPFFVSPNGVETIYLVEKNRKAALVVPDHTLLQRIKGGPFLPVGEKFVKPVSSFEVFTFLYRNRIEVFPLETAFRVFLRS
jgi:hypothetical protein